MIFLPQLNNIRCNTAFIKFSLNFENCVKCNFFTYAQAKDNTDMINFTLCNVKWNNKIFQKFFRIRGRELKMYFIPFQIIRYYLR